MVTTSDYYFTTDPTAAIPLQDESLDKRLYYPECFGITINSESSRTLLIMADGTEYEYDNHEHVWKQASPTDRDIAWAFDRRCQGPLTLAFYTHMGFAAGITQYIHAAKKFDEWLLENAVDFDEDDRLCILRDEFAMEQFFKWYQASAGFSESTDEELTDDAPELDEFLDGFNQKGGVAL